MSTCDELKITEENEKVSFCMEVVNEIETSMLFKFEKTSRYRSTRTCEWNDEDLVSLEIFETSEYVTRYPGCHMSWRARFFRDIYQEPHQYTVSLQLLSCELEGLQTTAVRKITARCWLRLDEWRRQMVNIEFDPRLMQGPGLFPISENIEIDRKTNENILPEWTGGPLWTGELFVCLDVHVQAQIQLKDLVLSNYGPEDFTIQRPIKLVHEEEENVVSLHKKSFCMFDITARSFRFEKFAKYSSSSGLKLFQSRIFHTDIYLHPEEKFPECEMGWRVRYFRDTFKNPIQHSLGIQLNVHWLKETEHAHVHVTCHLRINNWKLKSALVADFDMEAEDYESNRIAQLNGNKIEKLLAEAKDNLTVGLVVRLDIYRKPAPA